MDRRRKLAFTCFVANAVVGLAFAVVYLASPAATPYGGSAVDSALSAFGRGEQVVLLGLLRVGAGALVAAAIASLFLLGRTLRAGESWASTARPAEQLAMDVGAAYAVATVIVLTGALSPWGAAVASVVLPVAGWAVAAQHPKIRSLVARLAH